MNNYILETTTIIKKPLSEVFEFFSKAENLNKLTPKEVFFKILTNLICKCNQRLYCYVYRD